MSTDPIASYIERAPADQQNELRELRGLIEAALPNAVGSVGPNGFVVYEINGTWAAGFATRKKCPMLYVMVQGVLDDHETSLGGLRTGRSCIDYRPTKTMPMETMRSVCGRVLAAAGDVAREALGD